MFQLLAQQSVHFRRNEFVGFAGSRVYGNETADDERIRGLSFFIGGESLRVARRREEQNYRHSQGTCFGREKRVAFSADLDQKQRGQP